MDPTENVTRNLRDAVQRLDDIIEAGFLRQDDLRKDTRSHLRREMNLRAKYDSLLRKAESRRIDAIHTADAAATARTDSIQAAAQASLQRQVAAGRSRGEFNVSTAIAIVVALISLAGLVIVILVKG